MAQGLITNSVTKSSNRIPVIGHPHDRLPISNSNWTKWSTIQGVIGRVISKSDEHETQCRFEITSMITS